MRAFKRKFCFVLPIFIFIVFLLSIYINQSNEFEKQRKQQLSQNSVQHLLDENPIRPLPLGFKPDKNYDKLTYPNNNIEQPQHRQIMTPKVNPDPPKINPDLYKVNPAKHEVFKEAHLPEVLSPKPENYISVPDNQTTRQQRVAEICKIYRGKIPASRGWHYKLVRKHKFLYCPIPKSGWSSWKRVWFLLGGKIKSFDDDPGIQEDRLAGVADVYAPQLHSLSQQQVYNYSFVFVRNPWERLVSGYINKAVDYNYTRIMHTPCEWESMEPYKKDITFLQFLQCISTGRAMEMHWRPQHKLCDFCNIHYDYLGHLETAESDVPMVLKSLNLNISFPHIFASKKYDTRSVMVNWYKDIPAETLKKLYSIFRFDFLLFGYNPIPPGRFDVELP